MATRKHNFSWRWAFALLIYRLLGPLLLLIALPSWLRKMAQRQGWNTPFGQRFAYYPEELEWEPTGVIHYHAVSVGETMIALKLIRALPPEQSRRCVLAVSTATAYDIACKAALAHVCVVYAPIDLWLCVRIYLARFQPLKIVLIEAEAWPELLQQCEQKNIPVLLLNARLSQRSEARYRKFSRWVAPLFQKLSLVAVQENGDVERFAALGIDPAHIHVTGSIKFDPAAEADPAPRPEFTEMLEAIAPCQPIVLAASTHAGEEALLGAAIQAAGAFFLCVPRHAERREIVKEELEKIGLRVMLRSQFNPTPPVGPISCLVIDTTGELRDWTSHADIVIIGKSFLAEGGQNPAEAITAKKPLIFGPHMENFEPLASDLVAQSAAYRVAAATEIPAIIRHFLKEKDAAQQQSSRACEILRQHQGATTRSIKLLSR